MYCARTLKHVSDSAPLAYLRQIMIMLSTNFLDVQLFSIQCCLNLNHKWAILKKCPVKWYTLTSTRNKYRYTVLNNYLFALLVTIYNLYTIKIIIANYYTPIAPHACSDAYPVHEVMDVIIIVTVKALIADNAESILIS